jgi:hypothetical protein
VTTCCWGSTRFTRLNFPSRTTQPFMLERCTPSWRRCSPVPFGIGVSATRYGSYRRISYSAVRSSTVYLGVPRSGVCWKVVSVSCLATSRTASSEGKVLPACSGGGMAGMMMVRCWAAPEGASSEGPVLRSCNQAVGNVI